MALNPQQFKLWSVDQVSQWLESIHLSNLIPNFERHQICGNDLPQIEDTYLRDRLRVIKPGEVAVFRGAVAALVDQSMPPPSARGVRKVSAPPRNPPTPFERPRAGSYDKPNTYPFPRTGAGGRNYTVGGAEQIGVAREAQIVGREPQLKSSASAHDVLDDHCRYSGWIRKQGGGYKNWKKRYLILRIGCLYYFANETASHPKGCFTLAGYRTDYCKEPEITKKFKWALKITPGNPALRTYYIAVGAKRELFAWKQAIDEEILACERSPRTQTNGGSVTGAPGTVMGEGGEMGEGSSDEGDEEDGPIYDRPGEGDDEFNQDGENSTIYDQPDIDDEDESYSKIDEEGLLRLTSPTHTLSAANTHTGTNEAPTVPLRSAVSLGLDQNSHHPSPNFPPLEEPGESTYLPIIGVGSPPTSLDKPVAPGAPERPKLPPTAVGDGAKHHEPQADQDYEDDSAFDGDMYADDADTYYIMIRKPEELLPPSCVFDRLERPEAERLLRARGREGTYLIRAGIHAGTEKVLSVWHGDRCRHYKLFKDENARYSLTQGQTFGTIPELLQYYMLSAHLPRSDFYLKEPYHPQAH